MWLVWYNCLHLQFPLSVSRLMLTPTLPHGCETLTGGVLVCCEHGCTVYGLEKHLARRHGMPAAERRQLLAAYEDFALLPQERCAHPSLTVLL